jgi:gliding motility-associated-like protein
MATLAVPPGYASVLWSTGETTDQINTSIEGLISVIVIDGGGCIAFDTVLTDANAVLSPQITGDASICDAGTAVLNAGPGFDNYLWSNNAITQTISVNAPGTYTVTVSSNSGCVGQDDFTVTGFTSPFATVTATASACDVQEPGGPSTLINFNSLVTGGDLTGSWIQVSGPSPVNLANLTNVNFNGLNAGTYTFSYTTNTATLPCVEKSYTLTVTVTSCACPPVALNVAPDLCNDLGSISLSTLVLPQTQGNGTWTILSTPPGSNPGVINGSNFVASSADPGTYILQYQIPGLPAYCDNNSTVAVKVLRTPVAGVASAPLQYCAGESAVVGLATLLVGADPGGQWVETSQNLSTGAAFNAVAGTFNVVAQIPGTYTFSYVVAGPGPCPDDMTTVEVVIEANPIADAGATNTLDCTQPTTQIGGSGTSVGPEFSYSWTATNGGTVTNPNQAVATASSAGTYTLTVMNNLTGCSATDQVLIDQIGTFPTKLNLLVQSPDCPGDPPGSAQVSSVVGGIAPYTYSLNNAAPVASPVFNNLTAGDYTIEVTDATGCKLSDTFSIQSLVNVDLKIVNYVHDTLIFNLGDTFKLSYLYTGTGNIPDSLVWKSGDSVLCINCSILEIEARFAGTITLEAYDVRGCFISKKVTYQVVRKRDVYIPNIFSPNGDDLNDYFTLFTDSDLKEITLMEIYTRWGELVFRKTHFQPNDPKQGWDGKFSGDDLNPGVYVYRIEILYGDDLKDNLAGDVTIVR